MFIWMKDLKGFRLFKGLKFKGLKLFFFDLGIINSKI